MSNKQNDIWEKEFDNKFIDNGGLFCECTSNNCSKRNLTKDIKSFISDVIEKELETREIVLREIIARYINHNKNHIGDWRSDCPICNGIEIGKWMAEQSIKIITK